MNIELNEFKNYLSSKPHYMKIGEKYWCDTNPICTFIKEVYKTNIEVHQDYYVIDNIAYDSPTWLITFTQEIDNIINTKKHKNDISVKHCLDIIVKVCNMI